MRALFPLVADAVSRVLPIASLRWISFGHVEADECGAMNHWLEAVPDARVAFSGLGCMVSINDLADRPPRPLDDGESIDLGDKQVRYLATPPRPTRVGGRRALRGDHLGAAVRRPLHPDGRRPGHMQRLADGTDNCGRGRVRLLDADSFDGRTVERLADLAPTTLALMHGPTYTGDGEQWLRDLAANYRHRTDLALTPA
jgi:hypothetical protein